MNYYMFPPSQKSSLALKIVQEEVSDSFDGGECLDEKEETFFAKKFKKFIKFRKSESKTKPFRGAYDLLKSESSECIQNKDTKGIIKKKT